VAEAKQPSEGDVDVEEAAETAPGPLKRVAELVAPPVPPPNDDSSKRVIREALDKSDETVVPHFLEQARLRYEDVFQRVENVERRAGTLQTSVVFAVTLTLTGGALLLDSAKVPHEGWREALAAAVLVAIAFFAWSGLHATLAGTRTDYWKVVGKHSLQARPFNSLVDAQKHRTAAYIWCINHNMAVNQWKSDELGRGLRWFVAGLATLFVLAVMIAAYAVAEPPVVAEAQQQQQPATGPQGEQGPRGSQGEQGP
jgi:hypothetical protein